jgi:hypothetical protein
VDRRGEAAAAALDRALSKFKASRTAYHEADLDRVRRLGRLLSKRHLIWARVAAAPGSPLRLNISYRTRYAADYETDFWHRKKKRLSIVVDNFRRFVGQDPAVFRIPVSFHSLARSYHFHLAAPPGTFVQNQHFFLERNVADKFDVQKAEFKQYYRKHDASVSGEDQAGGPLAHLYANNLPGTPGNQVYAFVRVLERPPGTTAAVTWISLVASIFLWLYWSTWQQFATSDTAGIDVAAFLIAIPGIVSVWFSKAFNSDLRPNIPLLNRLALATIGVTTVFTLVSVLLHRGICSAARAQNPTRPCPGLITGVFHQSAVLAAAVLVTLLTARLFVRRVEMYRLYRHLQVSIANTYLR